MPELDHARQAALNAAVELHGQSGDLATDEVIATAAGLHGWLTGSAAHDPYVLALEERIASLEDFMIETRKALAELNGATNAVATRLESLASRLEADDSEAAALIRAEVTRLHDFAADPDNPVPDPGPEPEPV